MVATISAPAITPAERTDILDAARSPVSEALGKPVVFKVSTLNRSRDWAFLIATMEDRGGNLVDYSGTPKAAAAAEGIVSPIYAALLRQRNGRWVVVECAIGPTDVAWEPWAERYGAPNNLFP
jgi:hypothetical protein